MAGLPCWPPCDRDGGALWVEHVPQFLLVRQHVGQVPLLHRDQHPHARVVELPRPHDAVGALGRVPVWEDPAFAGVGGCQVLGDFEQLEVEVSSPAGKIGGARELGVTSACSFAPVAAASGVGPCNVASIIAHAIMVVALCSEDAILASSVHLVSHEQTPLPDNVGRGSDGVYNIPLLT